MKNNSISEAPGNVAVTSAKDSRAISPNIY